MVRQVASGRSFGNSAISASVVSMSDATEAAFCKEFELR